MPGLFKSKSFLDFHKKIFSCAVYCYENQVKKCAHLGCTRSKIVCPAAKNVRTGRRVHP